MSIPWQIRLLTRWDEIEDPAFLKQWQLIMEHSKNAHVFFHPVLVNVWLETYRPLRSLEPLFVLASQGEQQALFPLVLWRRSRKHAWIRDVIPAGYSDFDYHDPLFLLPPEPAEVASFYESLRITLNQTIKYDRLLIDGLHHNFLPVNAKTINSDVCLTWPLRGAQPVDELLLPAKKSNARAVRRRLRRLKELGEVSFVRWSPHDLKAADKSLKTMLRMHAKRWPNAYKPPAFHEHLIQKGLAAGLVDFVEMRFDERPIAWQISFMFKGRFSLYMPAIHEDFLQYGPGNVSQAFAMAEALANGMTTVDHLRGGEGYKTAWGGEETAVYDVVFDQPSITSQIRLSAFNTLESLKSRIRNSES